MSYCRMRPLLFRFYLISLLCLAATTGVRAQFTDDFSDGDFTASPAWNGDNAKFIVNNFQLQSNSSVLNDTFYLSTPSTQALNCEWDFWVSLQFNTSSVNYVDVYLLADQSNLKAGTLNGYFLRMGGTQDDISLFKMTGGVPTLLVAADTGLTNHSANTFKIKVVRSAAGQFSIWQDATGTGNSFSPAGSATDNTFNSSAFFGILIKQSTASFFNQHFFDNFYAGAIIVDNTPPALVSATALSANTLDVLFSEAVDPVSAQNVLNYQVDQGLGSPVSAVRDNSNLALVHLTFSGSFTVGTAYTLSTGSIQDLWANTLIFASTGFMYTLPQKNEVVINELMADESPAVGLPAAEFVELHNVTTHDINLGNYTFSDASTTQTLPAFNLQADSFVILCASANTSLFASYGQVIGLASLPSLNNSGDDLTLRSANGSVMNHLAYDLSYYHDAAKQNGGWTLEMIDAENPCGGASNWHASLNPAGGTPGRRNSVAAANPDLTAPFVLRANVLSADTVEVDFVEPMDSLSLSANAIYTINQGIGHPLQSWPLPPDYKRVKLLLPVSLSANVLYTLSVTGGTDCAGNPLGLPNGAEFGIPVPALPGDVVLNELLFNPKTYGSDYVEIYNNSEKVLDAAALQLSNHSTISPLPSLLLLPHSYWVFSTDTANVHANYTVENPGWLIQLSSLPSMDDNEGIMILQNSLGSVIDSVHYYDSWQFPLLNDPNGVALERINPNGISQDSGNWHSAASTAGFGTPTAKNSQYAEPGNPGNEITIEPQVFSPDNDGRDDVTSILYTFDQPGYVANIRIFDREGRLIRNLASNALLGQQGAITWDGIRDNQEKAGIGIYVVQVEVYLLNGKVKQYKKACVVAGLKN